MTETLKERHTHFEFGLNWLDFSSKIDSSRIEEAEKSLQSILQKKSLKDQSFLDIGCGSGLFSLAALRLQASQVTSIDIDENSVLSTQKLLNKHYPNSDTRVKNISIFDKSVKELGTFDCVYSWGVLHHTGSMWEAIKNSAELVKPGGMFAIALYRKTYLCPLWKIEKKLYTQFPRSFAPLARFVFKLTWILANFLVGKNPFKRIKEYHSLRGMSWSHDVHDWLGGYPYESASESEVVSFFQKNGFTLAHSNAKKHTEIGFFGSGCDEFLFRKDRGRK